MKAIEDIIDAEVIEDIEFDAPLTPRQQQIAELRRIVDVLEANPDIDLPMDWGRSPFSEVTWYASDAVEAARICKAIGGPWSKNDPNAGDWNANNMRLRTKVDREIHVSVIVSRGLVCERKVVGKKKVKKAVVVQAERTEERYVEVDDVQFECGSLLSAAAQLTMDRLAAIAS